jgi:hypothetical protein
LSAGTTGEDGATIPVLTFGQVRQAGRLAWHPAHHYLYASGQLLRVVLFSPPRGDPPFPVTLNLRPSSLHGDEQHIQTGWRHLDACDCQFCQDANAKTAGERKANGRSRPDNG